MDVPVPESSAGWACASSEEDELLPDQQQEEGGGGGDGDDQQVEAFETDPKRLLARQKQIDYGKNTLGYERYLAAVPKHQRRRLGRNHDPPTPDITAKMSKKSWDGIVKAWRRHLHKYDDVTPAGVAQQREGGVAAATQQAPAPPRSDVGRGRHSRRWRPQAGGGEAAGPGGRRAREQQQDQGGGRQQQQQQHAGSSQGAGSRCGDDAVRPRQAPCCEEHTGRSVLPAAGRRHGGAAAVGDGIRQGTRSNLTPAKRKAASQVTPAPG